jgi:hypothetical protein
MTPNETAIRAVLGEDTLVLAEHPAGTLRAVPDWAPIAGPIIGHERLVALLDGVVEAEWEAYVLWCLAQDHGKRHQLRGLTTSRGRIYAGQ